jgi:hydrogenase maturation protease
MTPRSGSDTSKKKITVLGIGNLLMGDEGVGVHVVRRLEEMCRLPDIEFVDGGTGGLNLLEYFTDSDLVVIIDAAVDGKAPGTVTRLHPEFSSDYPPTLVSHDIGLKDMLDAVQLLDQKPETILFTLTISDPARISMDLSPEIQRAVQPVADKICTFLKTLE